MNQKICPLRGANPRAGGEEGGEGRPSLKYQKIREVIWQKKEEGLLPSTFSGTYHMQIATD